MLKDKRKKYSESKKLEIIEAVMKKKMTAGAARNYYGIKGHDTIERWIRMYQLNEKWNQGVVMPEEKDNRSKEELSKALRHLEMEHDILKAFLEIKEEEQAASLKKKMGANHKQIDS